ncbi:MAG TPA: hypothetical protein VF039_11855 [Longimicrobiales bacterium]
MRIRALGLRLLPLAVALFAACSEQTPLEPTNDTAGVVDTMPPSEPFRTIDQVWADLARGPIPGFAGIIHEGADRVILMTDEGALDVARAYVDEHGRRPFANVDRVTRVTYDFAELYDWKMELYRTVETDFVTSVDINESANRLEVGAYRDGVDHLRAAAARIGIPSDAIDVVQSDMLVRGRVFSVDDSRGQLLLIDARTEAGHTFDKVYVHYSADLDAPRPFVCVEILAPPVVLLSDPPQIGARTIDVVRCDG